jgi:hypothetical protein
MQNTATRPVAPVTNLTKNCYVAVHLSNTYQDYQRVQQVLIAVLRRIPLKFDTQLHLLIRAGLGDENVALVVQLTEEYHLAYTEVRPETSDSMYAICGVVSQRDRRLVDQADYLIIISPSMSDPRRRSIVDPALLKLRDRAEEQHKPYVWVTHVPKILPKQVSDTRWY